VIPDIEWECKECGTSFMDTDEACDHQCPRCGHWVDWKTWGVLVDALKEGKV